MFGKRGMALMVGLASSAMLVGALLCKPQKPFAIFNSAPNRLTGLLSRAKVLVTPAENFFPDLRAGSSFEVTTRWGAYAGRMDAVCAPKPIISFRVVDGDVNGQHNEHMLGVDSDGSVYQDSMIEKLVGRFSDGTAIYRFDDESPKPSQFDISVGSICPGNGAVPDRDALVTQWTEFRDHVLGLK